MTTTYFFFVSYGKKGSLYSSSAVNSALYIADLVDQQCTKLSCLLMSCTVVQIYYSKKNFAAM